MPPFYCTIDRSSLEGCRVLFDLLASDTRFLYTFQHAFAFHGWSLFGKVSVEVFWLNSTFRRAFKKVLLIVLIWSQRLERLCSLEVVFLFCHQSYLLDLNGCEKWEEFVFPWLLQQFVENGQIAADDDSLGNLNSQAFSVGRVFCWSVSVLNLT